MRDKRMLVLTATLAAGIVSFWAGRSLGSPRPQLEQTARCKLVVPNEWGEYIGAGSYGLEFKDDRGTIRFVKQFSSGLEGAPNVSLEIHRK